VYARAAAAIIGIDRWKENRWKQEELFTLENSKKPAKNDVPETQQTPSKPKKTKKSYWDR
jgi:phage terminase large subunit GpA-like protein